MGGESSHLELVGHLPHGERAIGCERLCERFERILDEARERLQKTNFKVRYGKNGLRHMGEMGRLGGEIKSYLRILDQVAVEGVAHRSAVEEGEDDEHVVMARELQ